MDELELQTIDNLFDEISIGDAVSLPSSISSYDDMFRQMEDEAIQERSRRASAYREAAKIYLTF
ncbi:MAG: hypothetical protein IJ727_00085 [Treponema sp.]|nr:hypothetical protein [Treponema sp.]